MKVNFLGDIGIFKKFEELNIDPFDQIYLPESDLNIGNFEFVIHKNRKKNFYDVQERYSCSYEYLSKLKVNKFNGFGLANNHCMDYGLDGVLDTIDLIKKQNIEVFGFSNDTSYSIGQFEVSGIKIGIIACVKKGRWSKENKGYGPDDYNAEIIINLISELKSHFDHLVIFPHWGTELIIVPNIEDTKNAKAFIDAGASAVIGHHPHVPQGIERYKDGLIAYSLGSFIYLHEDELGFSKKDTNRLVSICLNIEFSKKEIVNYVCHYYRYNKEKKLPQPIEPGDAKDFVSLLNNNIYNQKLYKKELFNSLIKREFISFWQRFKLSPFKTTVNYTKHVFSFGKKLMKRK